ncbi:hypothetical protein NQ315_004642 [Exocentrus adspersus]|uniref:H/ACA ribonucleoprotein complex subunit n=1 Tax=Exocentrus adspersus TaxID=1586481 RepID=A0AAV8VNL7_9CUCU|nr:hypothetical protein NQ315_004642 [Exocentrus adspersus]
MSFRGRGGRNFNSGGRGGGGRGGGGRGSFGGGGRGGFGGGRGRNFDQGPPDQVIPLGYVDYSVQDDLVCKVEIQDVPYFNAPIYLENKEQIGKIDEIFGNIRDYSVTVRLGEDMKAGSFKKKQKTQRNYFLYNGFFPNHLAPFKKGEAVGEVAVVEEEEEGEVGVEEEVAFEVALVAEVEVVEEVLAVEEEAEVVVVEDSVVVVAAVVLIEVGEVGVVLIEIVGNGELEHLISMLKFYRNDRN